MIATRSPDRRSLRWAWLLAGLVALCAAPTPAVADAPGDVAAPPTASVDDREPAGLLLPDTQWETPYYHIATGEPGPRVVIIGGVHGNEPAGADAAEQIRYWPIVRGELLVIPRANAPGLAAHQRGLPGRGEGRRDLNRNFPTEDEPTPRGKVATAIWQRVKAFEPDYLVDLHEGVNFRASGSNSVGNSVIILRDPDHLTPLARQMLCTVNERTIEDEEHRFVLLQGSGGASGSLMRAARERLDAHSMITETVHAQGQRRSRRVRQHRILISTLLLRIGLLDESAVERIAPPPQVQGARRWVAVYDQTPGTSKRVARRAGRMVRQLEGATPTFIGSRDVRRATKLPYAAVIIAGQRDAVDADALDVLEQADLPLLWMKDRDAADQMRPQLRQHIDQARLPREPSPQTR